MGVLSDFLNSLSPIFSQDPQAYNAISLASNCYITISDDTLTVYETSQESSYALGNYTLSTLVTALNNAGLSATLISDANGSVYAKALLDVQAQASTTTPLILQGFSSDNYLLFKSQAAMLETALKTVQDSAIIFNIRSATGPWLDYWGWFLQVTRYDNEPDSLYAERIISLRLGHNVNNIAMQNFFARMGYTTTVSDTNPGEFLVNVILPTKPPSGFFYTTSQLSDAVNALKAAGVVGTVNLQGQLSDTVHITDSISYSLPSANWTVGDSLTIGQFTV